MLDLSDTVRSQAEPDTDWKGLYLMGGAAALTSRKSVGPGCAAPTRRSLFGGCLRLLGARCSARELVACPRTHG